MDPRGAGLGAALFWLLGPWVWVWGLDHMQLQMRVGVPPTSAFTGCHHKPPSRPSSYQQLSRPEAAVALFFCHSLQGALIRRPTFTLCCYPWWPGKASPVTEPPGVSGGNPSDSTPRPQEGRRKLGGSGSPFGRSPAPGTPGSGSRRPRWQPGRGAPGGEPGLTAGGPPRGSLFAGLACWLVYNLGTVEQEVRSQPAAQRASLACDSPHPLHLKAVSFPCLLARSPSGQGPVSVTVASRTREKPGPGRCSGRCGRLAEARGLSRQPAGSWLCATHTWLPRPSLPIQNSPLGCLSISRRADGQLR